MALSGKFVPGKTTKHLEVETYMYAGVGVKVRIDYDAGTVDLLDQGGGIKKWVFAGRSIEYMQGWQNILDAMKHAVEQATKKLSAHRKIVDQKKKELQRSIIKHTAKELS